MEYKIIPFKRWFIDLSEKILESSWFLESEPGGDIHIKLRKNLLLGRNLLKGDKKFLKELQG